MTVIYYRVYWRFSWSVATPLILSILIVASLINAGLNLNSSYRQFQTFLHLPGHVNYNGYVYPMWIQIIGYMITGKDYWID